MSRVLKNGGKVFGPFLFSTVPVVMFNSSSSSRDSPEMHRAAESVNVRKHPACKVQRTEAAFQTYGETFHKASLSFALA